MGIPVIYRKPQIQEIFKMASCKEDQEVVAQVARMKNLVFQFFKKNEDKTFGQLSEEFYGDQNTFSALKNFIMNEIDKLPQGPRVPKEIH